MEASPCAARRTAHIALLLACGLLVFAPAALLIRSARGQSSAADPAAAGAGKPAGARPGSVEEIVVRGRSDSLVGIAAAASEGTVGALQLEQRPLSRPGEVLETVPGVIIAQHSGAGKANQFFLRGFNLDHGTDFATSVDGVPVNLVSHGHGQGYTDLNFLIPELVERVNYEKGVYDASQGDFSSAGAASLEYFNELPKSIVQLEGGMLGFGRSLFAASREAAGGSALGALELGHADGPFDHGDAYKKLNGVLRYSRGDVESGWSTTASAYRGSWDATNQIARRAEKRPGFGRFSSLDESDGGQSQKYMLYGEWHRQDESSASRVVLYGFRQRLDLINDFTYFLTSPQGDQAKQIDRRWVTGGQARHTWFAELGGRPMENTVGLQLRGDRIENGLFQTVRGHRKDKVDHSGDPIPATTRRDRIWETSASPYVQTKLQWTEWLRTVVGVRADFFHFDVDGLRREDSGTRSDQRLSPKASIALGPWADTELYLSGGYGFHSSDARGVMASADPADPLVRSRGAELGVRTALVPDLQSTLSFWWLDVDSELIFVGDAGSTEASRPSRRYGIELGNYYSPTEWLTWDFDVSASRARFRDRDPAGRDIPGSVETVVATGLALHGAGPVFGELRLRYFGPRALLEDSSIRSRETLLLSARIGYALSETWTVSAEVFNLLNRRDSEIDYYYPSRLAGEPQGPDDGGVNDIHFHPAEPISFRLALTAKF